MLTRHSALCGACVRARTRVNHQSAVLCHKCAREQEQEDGDDEPEPRAAGSSDDEDDEPLVGGLARPKIRGIRGSVSPSSSDGAPKHFPPPPPAPASPFTSPYRRPSNTSTCLLPLLRSPADDEEMDEETEMDEGVIARFAGGDEEDIPLADETNRLAVVDLEWDRIRAVDIYAVRVEKPPPPPRCALSANNIFALPCTG